MALPKRYFEDYVALFPAEFQPFLTAKLACKKILEAEKRLKIPPRIWLAFLTPPAPEAEKYIPVKCRRVWQLKTAMLKALPHPKEFLDVRDPLHSSSECVTLALLETLYDLYENKVLLPEEKRYRQWLDVANHFGLWKLRYMLEDAIFKTFDPENFALFESVVQKQMFIDQHLILSIRGIVGDALSKAGIKDFSIENRIKNIYGVYNKVALKNKNINEIYDIHGFRVLTSSEKDCRKAIEVLHKLWRHFPDRYKDYIAQPKENGYRSVHTVLSCLEGKLIEFQVRTHEMDQIAASGPANHAEYKKAAGTIASS